MSTYDSVRPVATAKLLAIKVAVVMGAVLVCTLLITASYWFSAGRLDNFYSNNLVLVIRALFETKGWLQLLFQGLVWAVQLATLMLLFAAAQVYVILKTKNIILLFCGGFGLLVYTAGMASLGNRIGFLLLAFHMWLILALIALSVVHLCRKILQDNLLSFLQLCGVIGGWLCFVFAYFNLINTGDTTVGELPIIYWLWKSVLATLPILAVAISLRIMGLSRHRP